MAPTIKELGIDQLSVVDRLALVQEIWDSIADTPEQIPLTDAQKQVLDRRCADLDASPNNVLTWDQIREHVRTRR
jgi:putative addiction module component (TIGR02574 family)